MQKSKDRYLLDKENAIIVIKNLEEATQKDYSYIMIHERLMDNQLTEINRWYLKSYHFGFSTKENVIHSNLFKVRNGGFANSLCDFKNDKFVIPRGIWDTLEFGRDNILLEKYNNGILASFTISSDYKEGDLICYKNNVTGEKLSIIFSTNDGTYYAILELDGTIRGNKLFKGTTFSKIEEIIDLDEYESLEVFQQLRKDWCNQMKERNKRYYQEMLAKRKTNNPSPYLDEEVLRIIELKK